ncbi:MAG: TVP38/TMEM64 family protein [Planctomycetes bacterium]|nr:TVP38/TMEM64 family protein [Planctomycetota bacterium]
MKIDLHNTALRVTFLAIALVGVFCLFHFVLEPYMTEVDVYIAKLGFWGPVLFIALIVACTTFMIPESIFALAAGAIFGIWWGVLWVTIGGFLASFFIFFIGRKILRARTEHLLLQHPKLNAINQSISSFRLIALLRLSPFNFTLLSYLSSVSELKFSSYAFASIAMVPGFLSTTYIGFAAKHAADLAKTYKTTGELPTGDSLVREITIYGGLIVAVSVSVVVAKIAIKTVKNSSLS